MKIALASARTVDQDIAHNLSQLERYTKEAKAAGADLIFFGSCFQLADFGVNYLFIRPSRLIHYGGWRIRLIASLYQLS